MKILLTGSSGILGTAILQKALQFNFEVISLSQKYAWEICLNPSKINSYEFDVFVHAGANTNVEHCEQNPNECYRDNFLLTEMLANSCKGLNRKFIFISSTGVYGNQISSPYCEFHEPSPTTHYHRAKFLAEKSVLGISPSNLVLRAGWLFGGDFVHSKNFVARRIEEANHAKSLGIKINSNKDQIGSPTFNLDFTEQLFNLIISDHRGIFNIVNTGIASRFEYVQKIVEFAGIDVGVQAVNSQMFKRFAMVSNNESACSWKSDCLNIVKLLHWETSLKKYINHFFNH